MRTFGYHCTFFGRCVSQHFEVSPAQDSARFGDVHHIARGGIVISGIAIICHAGRHGGEPHREAVYHQLINHVLKNQAYYRKSQAVIAFEGPRSIQLAPCHGIAP